MKTKAILIFLLLGTLAGCTEVFEIETEKSSPILAVYGTFTDEETYHTVDLSVSGPYFGGEASRPVSGAEISIISSENEQFEFVEIDTLPGRYRTVEMTAGRSGLLYTLSVDVAIDSSANRKHYAATARMLPSIPVDSVIVRHASMMSYVGYTVDLYAQDLPDEDYYLARYKINDSIVLNRISMLAPFDDKQFNGQYMQRRMMQIFADGEEDEGSERYPAVVPGDSVTVGFARIEKGYYDFITQAQEVMYGEIPFFGGPPSNIATNVSGGCGYFAVYSLHSEKIEVRNEK